MLNLPNWSKFCADISFLPVHISHKFHPIFNHSNSFSRGTAVAQWLRCCAANRKVAGSMVSLEFFIDIKSFRSHYGPGEWEMSTRSISWGLRRPVRNADNLSTILGHCHIIWEPQLPGTLWAPRACNGTDLFFFSSFRRRFRKSYCQNHFHFHLSYVKSSNFGLKCKNICTSLQWQTKRRTHVTQNAGGKKQVKCKICKNVTTSETELS